MRTLRTSSHETCGERTLTAECQTVARQVSVRTCDGMDADVTACEGGRGMPGRCRQGSTASQFVAAPASAGVARGSRHKVRLRPSALALYMAWSARSMACSRSASPRHCANPAEKVAVNPG